MTKLNTIPTIEFKTMPPQLTINYYFGLAARLIANRGLPSS